MMAQFFTQAQKAMGATERVYLLLQEEHEGSRDPVKEPVRKNSIRSEAFVFQTSVFRTIQKEAF